MYTPSGSDFLGAVAAGAGGIGRAVLLAYDAKTGNLLLARPMAQDIMDVASANSAGDVSIARNTIYTPVNGISGGYVVAYRLAE